MNKWLYFVLGMIPGMVIGGVATIFFLVGVGYVAQTVEEQSYTPIEQPWEEANYKSFKVLQVLKDHSALVNAQKLGDEKYDSFRGPTFLLVNDGEKYYYDDEIINVPNDKKVVQVGRYHYNAKGGFDKTVSVIKILNR